MKEKQHLIDNIFLQLDGMTVRIHSSATTMEGSWEGKVTLKYNQYGALTVLAPLKYNQGFDFKELNEEMNATDVKISYEQLDAVKDKVVAFLENSQVRIGMIFPYNVTEMELSFNKKEPSKNILEKVILHSDKGKTEIFVYNN